MDAIAYRGAETHRSRFPYPAPRLRSGLARVNNTLTGDIGSASDHDWIRIRLIAGSRYSISVSGQDTGGETFREVFLPFVSAGGITMSTASVVHRLAVLVLAVGGVFALGFALPVAAVWSGVAGGFFAFLLYRFLKSEVD